MIDILNRNKRRTALWRITGLLVAVVAVFFTVSVSMHMAYGNKGTGEIEMLEDSLVSLNYRLSGTIARMAQDTVRLKKEIDRVKANDEAQEAISDLEAEIADLQAEVDSKDKKLDDLRDEKAQFEAHLKYCNQNP